MMVSRAMVLCCCCVIIGRSFHRELMNGNVRLKCKVTFGYFLPVSIPKIIITLRLADDSLNKIEYQGVD